MKGENNNYNFILTLAVLSLSQVKEFMIYLIPIYLLLFVITKKNLKYYLILPLMFLINIIIISYNTSAHNLDSLHKLPILINKSFQYGYFNQFSSKNKFYKNKDKLKLKKKFNSYIIPHKRLEIQETENIDKIKKSINKIIIYLRPYYEFIGTITNFTI